METIVPTVLEILSTYGIIPVVVIEKPEVGEHLAQALLDGGLPCMEITFRTDAAVEALRQIADKFPEITLGAGTVLTVEQATMALDAGAKFIVSPGVNRKVIEFCASKNVVMLPGVATPTDIEAALDMGLENLKLFPAEALGGVEYLKALGGPYKKVKFIPTGGIQQSNLLNYLSQQNVMACGGSWMVRPDLIKEEKFDEIRRLTQEAIESMLGFELRHIGINCPDETQALANAQQLSNLIRFPIREGTSSVFVGSSFEFTKKQFPGSHGHIAIGTNSIIRAIAFLERRGYRVRPETKSEKNGKLLSVYLEHEIAGFAIHLLQK